MATSVRDTRIDIIRGLAILTILLNHLTHSMQSYGLRGRPIPTPTAFGYSSAAEIFVFMSGYMVGLVYLGKPDPERRLLKRAGKLYAYNWLLLLLVSPFILIMQNSEVFYWRAEGILANPISALLDFTILTNAPLFLDILHLYIILMLVAPIAIFIYKRSPALLILVSLGIYIFANVNGYLGVWNGVDVWDFNPLAWQLIFFVPVVLDAKREHIRLFKFFEQRSSWKWTAALGLVIGLFAIAKTLGAERDIPFFTIINERDVLGPVRIFHVIVLLAFYAGVLSMLRSVISAAPFRFLAVIGRHSLNCFALGVVLTYALTVGWDRLSLGHHGYIAAAAVAIFTTFICAVFWDRSRSSLRTATA